MLFFAMSTLCYFRFSVSLSHITSDESKTVVVNTKSRSIKLTYCGPLPPLQSPPPFVSETPDAGAYCGDCLSPLPPYYCENHQTEEPMWLLASPLPAPPYTRASQWPPSSSASNVRTIFGKVSRDCTYINSIANENIFPHLTGLVFSFHVIQWEYLFSLYEETGTDIFTCTVNEMTDWFPKDTSLSFDKIICLVFFWIHTF